MTSWPTSRWSPTIRAGPRSTRIAAGCAGLADVPALLLWGARDPVFTERYLDDLIDRLPHADVQRYAAGRHLVTEDVPEAAGHVWRWVSDAATPEPPRSSRRRSPGRWAAPPARSRDRATAVAELITDGRTAASLRRAGRSGSEIAAAGLRPTASSPGSGSALLVPPGIDLTVAVYACWRAGAIDRGGRRRSRAAPDGRARCAAPVPTT